MNPAVNQSLSSSLLHIIFHITQVLSCYKLKGDILMDISVHSKKVLQDRINPLNNNEDDLSDIADYTLYFCLLTIGKSFMAKNQL